MIAGSRVVMRTGIVFTTVILLWVGIIFGQSTRAACDFGDNSANCPINDQDSRAPFFSNAASAGSFAENILDYDALLVQGSHDPESRNAPGDFEPPGTARDLENQGFHWRRALTESFTFLLIEQAYVIHTDFYWVVSENGVPFNHYWRDYKQSLSQWTHSGWNDGDPNWFGYVGHPIQGALTGFIQIQNDPKSEKQVFSKTKSYWKSRLKAGLWNAVYSTQWNLGPLSEVTVEKYGTKDRAPWTYAGTFPCTHHCLTGVGQIDIVMTPLGGTGWLIGEDFLDEKVVRRIEESTRSRFLIDTARVSLNPIRAGANMLHGQHPWYRAPRDGGETANVLTQNNVVPASDVSRTNVPDHGNVFIGYSYTGVSHCEAPLPAVSSACTPLSNLSSRLSGWDTSVEKMYLRYFGAIADFSGQYGNATQNNYLFGIRGGAEVGRLRPYAHCMIGAVRTRENGASGISEMSFAEDLGLGVDFRLARRFNWRNQIDSLKTGSSLEFERRNVRLSSGLAVRF
jgi:hypothetical protein